VISKLPRVSTGPLRQNKVLVFVRLHTSSLVLLFPHYHKLTQEGKFNFIVLWRLMLD
jgi:hypothetical protein